MAVYPAMTTSDMGMMIRMACAGAVITFGMVEAFEPYFVRGELAPLLEDYCLPFAGFYLYFPRRHRQPLKLRALVDHVRTFHRGEARGGHPRETADLKT